MTRLLFTVVACAGFATADAFPGLRRWPPAVRVPQEIQRIPVQLSDHPARLPEVARESVHLSLPDLVRNAVMCCKDMTAECMACATNQDLNRFCSEHSRIPGCERVLEKAREEALDGVVNKAVEQMAEKVGGFKAEQIVDRYLERNPDVARKNLVNLTSEAFDTVSSIKQSLLTAKKDANGSRARKSTTHYDRKKVKDEEDDEEDDDEDDDAEEDETNGVKLSAHKVKHQKGRTFTLSELQRNPWVIAISSVLITAVSTGIAVGALCHSRISAQAREPLLSTLLQDVESRTPTATSS